MRKLHRDETKITVIILMALFNFIFLGAEFLFDNMMACVTDERGVVAAQSYILGASVIGFILFPVAVKYAKDSMKYILLLGCTVTGVISIFLVQQHQSYVIILCAGIVLFILLGVAGSGVHYMAFCFWGSSRHLAKLVGTAYALGILLQFLNNNCVKTDTVQSVVLSLAILIFLVMVIRSESTTFCKKEESLSEREDRRVRNPGMAGISLILCVVLLTCIFSTLDNVVTLVHAAGSVNIGQWPRLLLAVSGLAAGVLYDLKDRRYMCVMMYCITLLSTICVVVIEMGGPFLAGVIAFYCSAGFFVVFFTVSFIELSRDKKTPALWAGLGRATNNLCAVLTTSLSVSLLSAENKMAFIILALVLFVFISIAMYVYQDQICFPDGEKDRQAVLHDDEKFMAFSNSFSLTDREQEVLKVLLSSDESVQEIAEELLISRAALYRHITSLNEKTGTKSRIGLLQFYYTWEK